MLTRNRNLGSIGDMKPQTTVLTLALCLFGAALSFAGDPERGTWKLNETKSKFSAEATKNHTVVYETVGENEKITADGTDTIESRATMCIAFVLDFNPRFFLRSI